jgi:hypothetical protein
MGFLSALFLGNRIFKLRKVTMHQHENQQANFEPHSGGAAPEQRRCQYIKADGHGCRDWAVRGQKLCYRHGVFVHSGRGIDVPLLEDESSIVLVLSETLRAVALGTIPLKSGALLLDGCRLAHTMQMERQKAANLERSRRRKEAREQESGEPGARSPEPNQECGAPSSEICGLSSEPCEEPCAPSPEPCEEPGAPCPEPSAPSSAPNAQHLRFRDRQENSDEHLAEVATEALFDPRYERARVEVLAAVAASLDESMEEKALALGVR